MMIEWMFDAFSWLVLPVAVLEAVRVARSERRRSRTAAVAVAFGGLELLTVGLAAATGSLLLLLLLVVTRAAIVHARERQWWVRVVIKSSLLGVAIALLIMFGDLSSLAELPRASLEPGLRVTILALLCAACVVAILPVRADDEPRETLVAPLTLIAFSRIALPLGADQPQFATIVPILAIVVGFTCALWLLSAGTRANHFEPATLVSELLVCERGVILSFVWLGLSSGEHLAGVGALLEWWSGALALLALAAALRCRPLPKPMAFFALAMAVGLPGTLGFVAEDLLAHGLLELRPLLAAAFVGVAALNAAALYLAIVNIIVDLRERPPQPEPRLGFVMLSAAGLALVMGLVPRPFVAEATRAHEVVVQQHGSSAHSG